MDRLLWLERYSRELIETTERLDRAYMNCAKYHVPYDELRREVAKRKQRVEELDKNIAEIKKRLVAKKRRTE